MHHNKMHAPGEGKSTPANKCMPQLRQGFSCPRHHIEKPATFHRLGHTSRDNPVVPSSKRSGHREVLVQTYFA